MNFFRPALGGGKKSSAKHSTVSKSSTPHAVRKRGLLTDFRPIRLEWLETFASGIEEGNSGSKTVLYMVKENGRYLSAGDTGMLIAEDELTIRVWIPNKGEHLLPRDALSYKPRICWTMDDVLKFVLRRDSTKQCYSKSLPESCLGPAFTGAYCTVSGSSTLADVVKTLKEQTSVNYAWFSVFSTNRDMVDEGEIEAFSEISQQIVKPLLRFEHHVVVLDDIQDLVEGSPWQLLELYLAQKFHVESTMAVCVTNPARLMRKPMHTRAPSKKESVQPSGFSIDIRQALVKRPSKTVSVFLSRELAAELPHAKAFNQAVRSKLLSS